MENLQTATATNALLMAARQMPLAEMEHLVAQMLAIRAARVAPHLTPDESALLARINQGLPDDDRASLRALVAQRDGATLTEPKWQELAALTDRLEVLHADRLGALVELAQLRGVTLAEVMRQLGVQFPDHD